MEKLGPLRIGKIRPLRIGKIEPLRVGKIGTPPDWDPSGFVKIASRRLSKFSPDTLLDTFSDAIMLFELTRKGVSPSLDPSGMKLSLIFDNSP